MVVQQQQQHQQQRSFLARPHNSNWWPNADLCTDTERSKVDAQRNEPPTLAGWLTDWPALAPAQNRLT